MESATLSIIHGNKHWEVKTLEKQEITIGRLDCDIVLQDTQASRVHAVISRLPEGTYKITDSESRNGTFVNGEKMSETRLSDEDRIFIGTTTMVFHDGSERCDSKQVDGSSSQKSYTLDAMKSEILTLGIDEEDVRQLQRAKQDLSVIYRAGQRINAILDTGELYQEILDIIITEFENIDYCSVHIFDKDGNELNCEATRSRKRGTSSRFKPFSSSIVDYVVKDMKAILTFDAQSDERFDASRSIEMLNIQSAICVPLQTKDRLIGVIQASSVNPETKLNEEDLKLLTAIGFQAGSAIANATLYQELKREKTALESVNRKLTIAQNSLIRSEKLAAVGQLTAGIVHDIKNPLLVINGHAELITFGLQDANVSELGGINIEESIGEIMQGVKHCSDIVNQLLQFARQSKLKREMQSVNQLLDDTVTFLQYEIRKHKGVIVKAFADDLPEIEIDLNQIKQVLINIIINALQALDDGGEIKLITEPDPDNAEFILLKIRDNGTGMPEDVKRSIFDPFFTTKKASSDKAGGTGLGLSVCHGIIEKHGGSISVDSWVGEGTLFTIRLPIHSTQEAKDDN